jgi:lysophospholipase L1-like esterase
VSWPGWMIPILAALVLVLASAAVWVRLLLRLQRADFWEFQIRAFEEADQLHSPEAGAVLFTGSSSIRLWRTLQRDMAPLRVLNRGFGGCHLAHVNHYAERIVLPHRPRAVVLYAGENDLGWLSRKTPEAVFQDFQRFVALVQAKLPGTRVYFLAIKRSLFRRGRWAAMDRANRLIREFAAGCKGVAFIDTSTPMLDAEGDPRSEYLPWYRLHLTAKGYELWASVILPVLKADLGLNQPRKPAGPRPNERMQLTGPTSRLFER